MKYYSTNNKNNLVSFKQAVQKGIADDGGLFLPTQIPVMEQEFFKNISSLSFKEIAFTIARQFIEDEIAEDDLESIINQTFNFPSPIVSLNKNLFVLELFHGPTLAFKDFGARFMANTLSYFIKNESKEIVILVATSGDTGSAVANGFYNVEGIKVILLYPSGKVSKIQEQQLTTLGGNITALEVEGTFDDCQRLVKEAFADKDLNDKLNLTSANSINIARLIPQSFYYFNAYAQVKEKNNPIIFSVPSGNLGNLTGGLIAFKMGLPVHKFIAACNSNDVVTNYIKSGLFIPKPSVQTISNAMDVGNPSNFARIISLFKNDYELIKKIIFSRSYSDDETRNSIKEIYENYKYVIDPHGAVGYLALKEYLNGETNIYNSIVLETAHPAKFKDEVESVINKSIQLPDSLKECLVKEKHSVILSNSFDEFKSFLIGK
ncbi:MAG: threonine synthase [Ignavibacteriales bacterium]|nr:threonine synthase [Ignavibacteriales bacterium]